VLVALGRDLAEGGNPQRLAQQMAAEGTPEAMWRFLVSLVRDILKREQEKFTNGFRDRVGSRAEALGFSDWSALFGPREQCSWLLSEALGTPPPSVPVSHELAARVYPPGRARFDPTSPPRGPPGGLRPPL